MKKMVAFAIALLVFSSTALAGNEIYLTIEVASHGSRVAERGQPTKTKVKEFRYAAASPRDLATGQASGRRRHEPIVIIKELDASSKLLQTAATQGELLPAVLFEFTRARGSQTEVYQTVRLTNAMVSSVKMVGGGGDRPMEEVSFTFQKIEYQHKDGQAAATDNWKAN